MKMLILATMSLIPTLGHARTAQIQVQTGFYSSPATQILKLVQAEIAGAAVLECGSLDKVEFLNDIQMNISAMPNDDRVANVVAGKNMAALDFVYPRVTVTAMVTCK